MMVTLALAGTTAVPFVTTGKPDATLEAELVEATAKALRLTAQKTHLLFLMQQALRDIRCSADQRPSPGIWAGCNRLVCST